MVDSSFPAHFAVALVGAAVLALDACAGAVPARDPRQSVPVEDAAPDRESVEGWIADARYAQALAAIEAALPSSSGAELARWRQLHARALRLSGRGNEAAALESAVFAAEHARASGDARRAADALFDLGALHLVRGELQDASSVLDEALAACEQAGGESDALRADVLVYVAECAYHRGDPRADVRALLDQAARIQAEALERDDPRIAFRLTREANLAHADGDDVRAVELGTLALASFRARLRPGHPWIALALHNLGVYQQELRDLPAAARALEEALDLRTAEGSPLAGRTLMLLAQVRDELGDREEARRLHAMSVDLIERAGGPYAPALRVPLSALALADLRDGDLESAEGRLRRVLAILERDPGARPADSAQTLELLGRVDWQRGRMDEARARWTEALGILEAAGAADSLAAVQLLVDLGFQHSRSAEAGAEDDAAVLLDRALAIQRRDLPRGHPDVAFTLQASAWCARAAGRTQRAFEDALEAAALVRDHLDAASARLGERDALGYATELTPGLALAVCLAAEDPGLPTRRAWDALIAARASVFDAVRLRRAVARGATDESLRARVAEADALAVRCAHLARAMERGEPVRSDELEAALRQRERAERDLAEAASGLRPFEESRRTDLAAISRARADGAALVAFARSSSPDAYVAFLLAPGSDEPKAIRLGAAAEIDPLVARVHASSRAAGSEAAWRTHAAALRERVWDPLEASIAGATEVLVVPDGALLLVDFAALPVGESEYVIDRAPPIHVLGSERDTLATAGASSVERPWSVLVVGAPDYGGITEEPGRDPARASQRIAAFPPLPASAEEAREVAALWTAGDATARVLQGRAATEAALRREAPRARVLHVATHGFAAAPAGRAGARGLAARPAAEPAPAEPLRLALSRRHVGSSGLALAGANLARGADAGDDGILSDEEVMALDLRGLDLAVLSACDGAAGEIQSGEGIFGLRRAFQLAGARAVVATLWPVADETARAVMTGLHARLVAGGTTVARALHEAKRAELARRRGAGLDTHPWHWAGFVVAGEPARIR